MYDGHGLFLALLQKMFISFIDPDYISYEADENIKENLGVKTHHQLEIRCQEDGSTVLFLTSFEGEVIGRTKIKTSTMTLKVLFDFVKKSYSK